MDGSDMRRIVLLGKTGAGKSSLANTIFNEELFKPDHTFKSGTKECEAITRSVNGRTITLIDTPGFFDTDTPQEDTLAAILSCITKCAPGPHAFLIVLKVEKFTEQEKDVFKKICQHFSRDALAYAVVVFTHGDQLPENMKLETFVAQNKALSSLVEKCGGRCHVFDNRYWKDGEGDEDRSNRFHVAELLKTIDKITEEHRGGCYTNEMLTQVECEIVIEEENIRQSSANMSQQEIRNRAEISVDKMLLIRCAGVGVGALLGAFLGVVEMVGSVHSLQDILNLITTAGGKQLVTNAVLGGIAKGCMKGLNAAEGARTVTEAMQRVWNDTSTLSLKPNEAERQSKEETEDRR